MKSKRFESQFAELELIDGILIGIHKPVVIDLIIAKTIVQERIEFTEGKSYPILIKDYGVAKIEKQAREYFNTPESYEGITACAILTNSIFKMTLANFFIKMSKQPFPVRLFKDQDEATEWLTSYKTHEHRSI